MNIIPLLSDFISKNWINILFFILGLIPGVYFYFKGKKTRTPTYIVRSVNLVKENIQKIDTVDILYSKEKIQNLSVSKIAFWNDGKATINKSDITAKEPIKLAIKDGYKFLDIEILFEKNKANDFKVEISEDNRLINISFDYCDFEEGVVLQIFHTANSSEDIYFEGKIKAVKEIYRKELSFLPKKIELLVNSLSNKNQIISTTIATKKIMGWVAFFMGLGLFLMSVLFLLNRNKSYIYEMITKSKETDIYLFIIFGFISGIIYMFMGYNYLRKRIPKGFDIFHEEF